MNPYSKISTAALQGCDPAELGQLTATVERILPAIEKFWRYDGRDDAARRRPDWLARLDVPLPEDGGGIGAVVADLAEAVIPNGARVSEPGWVGFITTGPTTSAVAAWLAAALVLPENAASGLRATAGSPGGGSLTMTPLLPPASIRRCPAQSRSFLPGPDGPAGAPPGHRLGSGVLIGLQENREQNKDPYYKVSTVRGEPRQPAAFCTPRWYTPATGLAAMCSLAGGRRWFRTTGLPLVRRVLYP